MAVTLTILIVDDAEETPVPHGMPTATVAELLTRGLNNEGHVIFTSGSSPVAEIASFAFATWDCRVPALLVRRLPLAEAWPPFPVNAIVDVEEPDWPEVTEMLARTFGPRQQLRPYLVGREPVTFRWFRADRRPGPAINAAKCRIGWDPDSLTFVSAFVPLALYDVWSREWHAGDERQLDLPVATTTFAGVPSRRRL